MLVILLVRKKFCKQSYRRKSMKQIIVLAAFIALGLCISGIVLGFEDNVDTIGTKTESAITSVSNNITGVGGS